MKKVTYEEKITALDRYIQHPQGVNDPEILRAVKVDVIKVYSKGAKASSAATSQGAQAPDNSLYNSCMGVYRQFLKDRNSQLDMSGKKAYFYSEAMKGIIRYMQEFAKNNQKPSDDASILRGVEFLFNQENWNRLNNHNRNRIKLSDIYENIEEILPIIRNGYDKKSAAKTDLQSLKHSLKNG